MRLILVICLLHVCAIAQTNNTLHTINTMPYATNAKHPSWCKVNCQTANVIVYHQLIPGSSSIYQIWSMAADGSNQTCLSCTPYAQSTLPGATCGPAGYLQCQQGNPEWAPNGDIVFQAERNGCTLASQYTVPGTGLCADLVECDPNFATNCTTIATSGSGSDSGFLQYRFSADGTKLFGGHVTAQSGTCTAIFGEALAIRIFNWSDHEADQIMYTGQSTLDGDLLPASYMLGNSCDNAFEEGATTYPTSVEPVTKTLFFSMVGNTTQAFRQYSMDISSGDAATILNTLKVVSPGGSEWSEMGRINPWATHYAFVSSHCTPDAPPVKIANVALDLAIEPPGGGTAACATTYNVPGTSMYDDTGNRIQVEDFDWGPADGVHNNLIIANVSDDLTFDNIYLFNLYIPQVGPPVLVPVNPVVNDASYTAAFASGQWVAIFGNNMAPDTRTWTSADFTGNGLPTSLDGVSATIDGKPAYVYFISPGQINVLAPDDTTQGKVSVQVTSGGIAGSTVTAVKQMFVPAFFMAPADGSKYVVATHSDYTLVGPTSLYPGNSTPARPGEVITLWGTGFGPTKTSAPSGEIIAAPAQLSNNVTVTIGGASATVDFAGRVEPGVDQINVTVPNVTGGDQSVVASIGGDRTQANALITIQ
jgi:uncharacterized protein (TIGR03437 family)